MLLYAPFHNMWCAYTKGIQNVCLTELGFISLHKLEGTLFPSALSIHSPNFLHKEAHLQSSAMTFLSSPLRGFLVGEGYLIYIHPLMYHTIETFSATEGH